MSQPQLPLPLIVEGGPSGFLIGDCNRGAAKTVLSWPRWPGPAVYLFGPPASGKSRLCEVWAEMSGAQLLAASDLTSRRVEERHLVVDDLERLQSEEALFHLTNEIAMQGGSLLLVARRPPNALGIRLRDLDTRLRAAAIAEITPPDQIFLEAFLIRLAEQAQLALDPAIAAYCVSRMERSQLAAVNLMAALDRRSLASGRRLSARLAAEVLDEMGALPGAGP